MKELIDSLTKNLNISGAQAEGGAAVLFKAAKDKMGGDEFGKLLGGVPGLGDLMKKVPASSSSGLGAMFGGLASAVGGNAGLIATIVSGFGKLGLKADDAKKFAPVMLDFLRTKISPDAVSKLEKTLRG